MDTLGTSLASTRSRALTSGNPCGWILKSVGDEYRATDTHRGLAWITLAELADRCGDLLLNPDGSGLEDLDTTRGGWPHRHHHQAIDQFNSPNQAAISHQPWRVAFHEVAIGVPDTAVDGHGELARRHRPIRDPRSHILRCGAGSQPAGISRSATDLARKRLTPV